MQLVADNNAPSWEGNDYVGYCGDTSGGYVVLAQEYLMNDGLYPYSQYRVDDYFGTGLQGAVLAYQNYYGLSADGCIGPNTWNTMQQTQTLDGIGICANGSYLVYSGDGGSETDGSGGSSVEDTNDINSVITGDYTGGPVYSSTPYAFDNLLVAQNICTGAYEF